MKEFVPLLPSSRKVGEKAPSDNNDDDDVAFKAYVLSRLQSTHMFLKLLRICNGSLCSSVVVRSRDAFAGP